MYRCRIVFVALLLVILTTYREYGIIGDELIAKGDGNMDRLEYSTASDWLNWINKRDREKMARWLMEHADGKTITKPPEGRDCGQSVFCMMAARDYHGDKVYYAIQGDVLHLPNGKTMKHREIFVANEIKGEELLNLLAIHGEEPQAQDTAQTNTQGAATYNPEIEYIVSRAKTGRPRAALTDDEKARIKAWRQDKRGYNRIAADLRRSNRLIMAYCKEAGL